MAVIWNVQMESAVNDPKIKYSVERPIRGLDPLRIANSKGKASGRDLSETSAGAFDHLRVNIEGVYLVSAKAFEYELSADASTAADFQDTHPFGSTT
jgi:hypothetical protein